MLVDLKLPKPKNSNSKAMMAEPAMDSPKYPYGLRITIDGKTLEKFPDLMDAKAGAEINITAVARIKQIRNVDGDTADSYEKSSVELQLTKLGVSMEKDLDAAFNEED